MPHMISFTCKRCINRLGFTKFQYREYHDRWLQHNILADWEWKEKADELANGKRKSMMKILEERGFIHQIAGGRDELEKLMNAKRIGAYVGVDPTAPSLHIGHMVPFMALFWMYFHGFGAVTLLGGSTAQVGDPTGRTSERERLDNVERKTNLTFMHKQLTGLWIHVEALARKYGYEKHRYWRRAVMNNNVWLNKVSLHEVMKLMGSGLRMGSLLSRDSVKLRMESKEGMSLAEFCYPLLQAWDWWHMYNANNIQLQIGGSDQFGNIITGIEAVKHVAKNHPHQDVRIPDEQDNWEPFGFTVPLLTTSSGEKFGKSAGNAVWLNAEMTSPFDLYAYLLATPDPDIERLLKLFTFMPLPDIAKLMQEHATQPEKRLAQHKLAQEFLELALGESTARATAQEHTDRSGQRKTISFADAFDKANAELEHSLKMRDNPRLNVQSTSLNPSVPPSTAANTKPESKVITLGFLQDSAFPAVLYAVGLVNSKSEGQRLINNRGAYVAKYKSDLNDHLEWSAITSTTIGSPAKWVVWNGAQSKRGLLALRVGKWKVKVIHVHTHSVSLPPSDLTPQHQPVADAS